LDLVRLVSGPVIIGFIFGLMFNPLLGGLGLMVWLVFICYLMKRLDNGTEQ